MSPRWLRLLFPVGVTLLASTLAAAPLPQRAYVWQRAWSPRLVETVRQTAPEFAAFDILAAEIRWAADGPEVVRVPVPWTELTHVRSRGVVVRVGPHRTRWEDDDAGVRLVAETCRAALNDATTAGGAAPELQIDFDAATAGLGSYAHLLREVRRQVHPARLVITTLPDWLRSPDFGPLVGTADAFVLQVHSLEKPRRIDDAYSLCEPARAAAWIKQAAAHGRPFRVALPAYGYRLVFDREGNFSALEAEGAPQPRPDGFQRRFVEAEPAKIAECVQLLLASPPPGCEGLVWFRLPAPEDELAWAWPTLRAVMSARVPAPRVQLRTATDAGGALDLLLANDGEAAAEPAAITVTWRDARLLAADGLGGWQVERRGPNELRLRPPPFASNGRLRPGDALRVAWARFDRPAALHLETGAP